MSWGAPVSFDEAIRWFRDRVPMTDAEWEALTAEARDKAFTVAGVAQLDLVTQVWEAVERAIATGTDLAAFKAAVGESLRAAWAGTVAQPAWRLETIFRTNVQLAYSRGRHEQATDPDVLAARPFWMFDAVLDGRTTSICKTCDGQVLPADHPWWKHHVPPLHFNCRSAITTLTEDQAREMGIARRAPAVDAEPGFGAAPVPAAPAWEPDPADYPRPLWNARKTG